MRGIQAAFSIVFLLVCVSGVQALTMETVSVGNPGNPGDTRYPRGEVSSFGAVAYAYNIGKYEVTAGQYTQFLNAVAQTDNYGLYNEEMWNHAYGCKIARSGGGTVGNPYTYSVAGDYANRPVNYVSWGDSARFCNWLHNGQASGDTEHGSYFLNGATSDADLLAVSREADATWAITSEDEWYKAAYHKNDGATGNYFDYPTSSDSVPSHLLVEPIDSGNNATFFISIGAEFTIGSPYYRTEVGAHENSESPYGTFDQGGNVWEWNEAVIHQSYGSYRGLRGGAFDIFDYYLYAGWRSSYVPPTNESYNIGLRVAMVPEPASMLMLAFGGLALLRRR